MTTKTFFGKLRSGYIWANIAMMGVVVVLLVLFAALCTSLYTHHGEAIPVPDIRNKKFADAEHLLHEAGLVIVVSDTAYNRHLPPDCVLAQLPLPGSKVKSGRIIYVTINASLKPTLVLPDIIDNSSLREATARLKIMGFKVGEPQFIPGEKDWVYGVVCRGRQLAAGDHVPLDAMVVLLVGNGQLDGEEQLQVTDPDYAEPDHEFGPDEIDPFEEVTE